MYEVEIKIEITDSEKKTLAETLDQNKFIFKGSTPQKDFYVETERSPLGGYNIRRYRDEAGKFIYTEKVWEMVLGQPTRREGERELTREDFEESLKKYPNATKIFKNREWFACKYSDTDISLVIDTVKFDHSRAERYFVEAEVIVLNKDDVPKTKDLIGNFFKEILNKSDIVESPSMFTMAFERR